MQRCEINICCKAKGGAAVKEGDREWASESTVGGLGRICCQSEDSGSSPRSSRPPPSITLQTFLPAFLALFLFVQLGGRTSCITRRVVGDGASASYQAPLKALEHLQHRPRGQCLFSITLLTASLIVFPHPAYPRAYCQAYSQACSVRISRCIQIETSLSP